MRPVVKPVGQVADKWERRAGSAGNEFSEGVRTTSADWQASTVAAKDAWKAGINDAIGRGAFEKGVAAAGNARWKDRTIEVGPMRYQQGVSAGKGAFTTGIGPVLSAIAAVDLPPRGQVGSESNYTRSSAIGKALRTMRIGRK